MLPALNTAASGLQQFQQDIDVIGNNIANVNTSGYKAERMDFEDAFSQALGSNPNLQVGSGLSAATTQSNFSGGAIASTGDTSDLAISGNGFFEVQDPNTSATYFTRAGDFHVGLDKAGTARLFTSGGMEVMGYNDTALSTPGALVIDGSGAPATSTGVYQSFSVGTNGVITVTMSDGTQFTRGQVLLQQFTNPDALVNVGDNLYSATAAAGAATATVPPGTKGAGTIQDSALEGSNVDLTTEMSNLITAQRAFEANAKIITTSDEVLQDLVNLKR